MTKFEKAILEKMLAHVNTISSEIKLLDNNLETLEKAEMNPPTLEMLNGRVLDLRIARATLASNLNQLLRESE